MACSTVTLAGLGADCKGSIGGIKKVYIGKKDDFTFNGTVLAAASEGKTLKRFFVRKNTSALTSTLTIDDANGIEYWDNQLSLVFARQSKVKREQVTALVSGAPELIVVAEDSNGVMYLLGTESPVTRSAAGANTGTAVGDGNNYTITLQEASAILPIICEETTVPAALLEDVESAE